MLQFMTVLYAICILTLKHLKEHLTLFNLQQFHNIIQTIYCLIGFHSVVECELL